MRKNIFSKVIVMICASLLSVAALHAQHNTSSPYSRYGYGNIIDGGFGQARAMGGLSFGLRPTQFINPANPASYTAIDSLNFRFEAGASFQVSHQKGAEAKSTTGSGNLEFIALQFPIRRWIAFSAGVQPYSVVGYDFQLTEENASSISSGSLKTTYQYAGEGGISQVYAGLSLRPLKWLAVGGNFQFNFGTIRHNSISSFEESSYHPTTMTREISVKDISGLFGLQAIIPIKQKHSLTIGGVCQLKSKLNADATQEIITTDTVVLNFDNNFDLPMHFGAGLVYQYSDVLLIGFDYKKEMWSDSRFFGEKEFLDRNKISAGAQLTPDVNGRAYFQRVSYRIGANFSKSYYEVNGEQLSTFSLTTGWGLPLRKGTNPTLLNITFEYGHNGSVSKNLIREQYFKFTLNATINERWFEKRRLN
jgi:hypothetical protein